MAGGILKGIGITFLIVGILAILAGLGAAAYAYAQERDNQEQGLFANGQESRNNKDLIGAGAVAAAAGLAVTLVGIILTVTGGSMARRELARSIATGLAASGASTAPSPGAPEPGKKNPATGSGSAPARASARATAGASAGTAAARIVPPADATRPRADVGKAAAVLLGVLVVIAAIAWAFAQTGGLASFIPGGGGKETTYVTMNETFEGTVQGFSVGGMAFAPTGENDGDFTVPTGSAACIVFLGWTPATGGPERLELELNKAGGEVNSTSGAPGFSTPLPPEGLAGATFHYAVFADGDVAFVPEQAFDLRVVCVA